MATKPKAILSTHDGREASPITKASNVLFENGQTAQDILNDRQDAMISPVIENSSSMFKVGRGDNVDFSENVANGAYESITLKGKTMVNCIQESSSQDVVLPYEFQEGHYVTINDTKESGALGVELKGQTLVNLSPFKEFVFSGSDNSGGYDCAITLQINKSYIMLFDLTNSTSVANTDSIAVRGWLSNGDYREFGRTIKKFDNGRNFVKITSTEGDIVKLLITCSFATEMKNIMVIEYQEGMENWDIPYFEGMSSCKMPILSTVGKNLFDINKCISGKSIDDNGELINSHPHHYAIEEFIKIDNTITISVVSEDGAVPDTTNGTRLRFYDKNKKLISSNWFAGGGVQTQGNRKKRTFTVNGAKYLRLNFSASGGGADTSYEAMKTIQIENRSSMTSYEPHKSSILSLPEEVELRGIDDIKDTLDLATGELIQRIDKVVLDGGEDKDLKKGHWDKENTVTFYLNFDETATQSGRLKFLCNELKFNNHFYDVDEECILCTANVDGTVALYIRLLRSRLENVSVEGLKSYLSKREQISSALFWVSIR